MQKTNKHQRNQPTNQQTNQTKPNQTKPTNQPTNKHDTNLTIGDFWKRVWQDSPPIRIVLCSGTKCLDGNGFDWTYINLII